MEPSNGTCQHLEIVCDDREVVTASTPPVRTTEIPSDTTDSTSSTYSTNTTPSVVTSSIQTSPSDSSSFPVVGVIVGIISALLIVSMALVISVVIGGFLWTKKRKCPAVVETNPELS